MILGIVIAIGLSSALYLYEIDKNSLIYYNDSISHLVRSREFVDSMKPGLLEQLGTSWLPLPHLLLLPFTLIDPLFKSGFAGLAVSLPCFAITSVLLYRIIRSHIGAGISFIAVIGALLFASNPNMIYLGISPMTESPFMLFFVASAYYFQKWYQRTPMSYSLGIKKSNSISKEKSIRMKSSYQYPYVHRLSNLLKCSLFLSFATLSRYEAWILPLFLVFFVIAFMVKNRRDYDITHKALAIAVSILSFFGIGLWVIYNAYFYNDPFEFQNAEFWSAAAQAKNLEPSQSLYHQPLKVASVYLTTALYMYGPVLLIGALIGFVFDCFFNRKEQKEKGILYLYLVLPALVVPVSLVMGTAELNTRHQWFNSRYLVILFPLVILFVSVLIARLRQKVGKNGFVIIGAALTGLLFISQLAVQVLGIVTFSDAKWNSMHGSRPFTINAAEALESSYTGGTILIITGSPQQNNIRQASGIALKNFDTVLNNDTSKPSFKEPWLYANYIVIGKRPDLSAVNISKYWQDRHELLNHYFDTIYDDHYYMIMAKKNVQPLKSIEAGNTTRTYIIHQR